MSESELGATPAPPSPSHEPMLDAQVVAPPEGAEAPDGLPGEAAPREPCCAGFDPETARLCELCQRPICGVCGNVVNGHAVCTPCREQILADLAAEQARGSSLLTGLGGGLAAALVSGIVWAVIAIVTGFSIGYVAVGVGYLAGYGVLLGARRKKAAALQWIAVGCSALGLLLGKYLIVAHLARKMVFEEHGVTPSYLNPRLIGLFFANIGSFLSPFDALWLILALGVAWGLPRPTKIT